MLTSSFTTLICIQNIQFQSEDRGTKGPNTWTWGKESSAPTILISGWAAPLMCHQGRKCLNQPISMEIRSILIGPQLQVGVSSSCGGREGAGLSHFTLDIQSVRSSQSSKIHLIITSCVCFHNLCVPTIVSAKVCGFFIFLPLKKLTSTFL